MAAPGSAHTHSRGPSGASTASDTRPPILRGGVIEVGGYILMSATGCGGQNVGAHVLAHELGHLFFGLPDIYHPVGGQGEVWATRRWGGGCFELIAAGSSGGG